MKLFSPEPCRMSSRPLGKHRSFARALWNSSVTSLLIVIIATTLVPSVFALDEIPEEINERFKQAANRTFRAFDSQQERTWQGPYFFLQLADTQYGMFTGNEGFEQEAVLLLTFAQGVLSLFADGDIPHNALDEFGITEFIADQR